MSTAPDPTRDGPLAGIRVLDVSTVLAGPLAAQLLGDFGAEVIKIEHPTKGDSLRTHGRTKDGHGLWWKMLSRNKRCIGLYLGDPDGADLFVDLVRTADVVIENFRPGTLERWGVGYERLREVNPGVVLVRVTGFGQDGPYRNRAGFGTLAEAMSGFASITGEPDGPPTLPPFGLADSIAGITGAFTAVMGLYHRDVRDGDGQQIDLSLLEPLVTALGPQPITYDQTGEIPERTGNRSHNNAPRNAYRTADGKWAAVSASATSVAERVLRLVGRDDLADQPWFSSGAERAAHADEIDDAVGSWIAARTRDEVVDAFEKAEAAVAPIYDVADLLADPQVQALDMVTTVEDPDLGPVRMQNVIARMSTTPGRIRHTGQTIGAETDDVLRELGVDDARLAELRTKGVIS